MADSLLNPFLLGLPGKWRTQAADTGHDPHIRNTLASCARELEGFLAEFDAQGAGGGATFDSIIAAARDTYTPEHKMRSGAETYSWYEGWAACVEYIARRTKETAILPSLASDFTMEDGAVEAVARALCVLDELDPDEVEFIDDDPGSATPLWEHYQTAAESILAALNATFTKGQPAGEWVPLADFIEQDQEYTSMLNDLFDILEDVKAERDARPTPAAPAAEVGRKWPEDHPLVRALILESERAIAQAKRGEVDADGKGWDTCFAYILGKHLPLPAPGAPAAEVDEALSLCIRSRISNDKHRLLDLFAMVAVDGSACGAAKHEARTLLESIENDCIALAMLHPTAPAGEGGERT